MFDGAEPVERALRFDAAVANGLFVLVNGVLIALIDAEAFLGHFDLTAEERRRIRLLRPLFAAYWVMRLLPGGGSHDRNPPGTLERQASRLLDLAG